MRVIIGDMRWLLLTLLAAAVLGCGSSLPTSTPAPTEAPAATPEPPRGRSDEEIQQAMRERVGFGLRADEPWVRSVAADPNASTSLLGFPLTKAEEIEFQGRQQRLSAVADLAQRYAAGHQGQFAGLAIDQQHRLVIIQFTADIETHTAALARLIPGDDEPLVVRLASMSKADLDALVDRIVQDRDWLRSIDAAFTGAGVDELNNRVDLEISSANPAAAALIASHFGVGPAVLNVISDGTGIVLQPKGNVRGRVVNADGTPAVGDGSLTVNWSPDNVAGGAGDCGGGDIGYGVGERGRFELPCAPGGWTITITTDRGKELGRGHVVVPPGLAVNLEIRLDR